MRIVIYGFLGLVLALPAAGAWTDTPEESQAPAKESAPLNHAADEFKVLTRELGMRPGTQPSRQVRRKKMLWHGRIYENFRNDVLDAVPHEVKQNGQSKSPLRRNQFGFNVSGPVLLPHLIENPQNTFFMLSFEGVRESIYRASLHTIPTLPQRLGDFSQTVDPAGRLLPIYDPATTAPNPDYNPNLPVSTSNLQYLRSPFPGNRIPIDRLDSTALAALSLYPPPNTDVGPFWENNYFVNSPAVDNADGIIARVDHPFNSRHRVTSNTNISSGFLGTSMYFPNFASPTAPDQHFSNWRTELDYVFTANANTVNSASLSVSSNRVLAGENTQAPFPRYDLGNYLAMGTAFPNSRNARNVIELVDSVSTRKGKHALRLTFQANQYQVNSFNPAYPSGEFLFDAGLSSLPGIIDTGDPFASFLLGLPSYAEHTIVTSPSYFRNSYQALSAADKYEYSKNLTLSVDLTLSRRTARVEKYNRQSTIDTAVIDPASHRPGALVFAGVYGVARGLRPDNVDLDGDVGLAWNPLGDAKTVVRASYGRSHGQIPIYDGQWCTQGFNARQTFVSANTQLSPALPLAASIPPLATPLPDLSFSAADNTVADFMELSRSEPVYQYASFSLERETPFSMVVSTGANYSYGRDLLVGDSTANPNAVNPQYLRYGNALYDEAFRLTLQPYPQFKGFELYGLYPAGAYERTAGYLRVEKRASFGLSFIAYYSISKQLDDYSGPYGNQDFINLHDNWSLTSYNSPQYFTLSYVYELPIGASPVGLSLSDWPRALVSGWSVSGTAYWNDGTPLALRPEFNNTGNVISTLYVNVVPGVDPHVLQPGPSGWYNPAAFDQPPDFTLGNGPRTLPDLLGPGFNSMDLSLNKRLPVGGDRAFELTVTAFNFVNHGNWNYPDPNIGPASAPNVNAGKIIDSHGGRVVQLGLKFSF